MALINRITRLFHADMHAMLDRLEEPEALLKQSIREMDDVLLGDRQRSKLLAHEKTQVEKRQQELLEQQQKFDAELDLCFASKQEDLARDLIRRSLETRRLQTYLHKKLETIQEELDALTQRLQQNQSRLLAMQQKLELLNEEQAFHASDTICLTPDLRIHESELEIAFLREQQRRQS